MWKDDLWIFFHTLAQTDQSDLCKEAEAPLARGTVGSHSDDVEQLWICQGNRVLLAASSAVCASLSSFVWILFESIGIWRVGTVMYERQHFTKSRTYVFLLNQTQIYVFFSSLCTVMVIQNFFTRWCMKFWKTGQRGLFCSSFKAFKEHIFGFQGVSSKFNYFNQMLILELLLSSKSRFEDEISRSGIQSFCLHGPPLCVWVFWFKDWWLDFENCVVHSNCEWSQGEDF